MATEYALTLADPRALQLELAGGKGASLARMAAAELPVPPGFHVTTGAYRRFVEANSLREAILEAVAEASAGDSASLERASNGIRALSDGGTLPGQVAKAIKEAYAAIGKDLPVAVRSSATAEDLPGMSFAGQQESYLNVRGEDAVLEAVRRCWASLWTARAISYRLKMGVDQRAVSMAVVVQAMVPSEASGVLFTANPTTGDRDEMVVDSSFGLGEAVVSGSVTPDSFVLDKASLAVKERSIANKESEVVPGGEQGTLSRQVGGERRGQPSLSNGQLAELGQLALRVEALFGGTPQDIEWAIADGRVYLLQSRPMTGLPPAPLKDVSWEPPVPGTKWVRRQVAENMPEPLSPLFEELYVKNGLENAVNGVWEMAEWKGDPEEVYDRPMYTTVNGYAYSRASIKRSWKSTQIIMGIFATGYVRIFRRGIRLWTDDFLPPYLATVERWKAVDPEAAPDEQLLEGIRELAYAEAMYWYGTTIALALAKVSDVMLNRFLTTAVRRKGITSALFLRGFPTKAVEAEAELEAIAGQVRGSEALRELVSTTPSQRLPEALESVPAARPVLDRLRLYLDRYGHLVYNLDFAEPTQAEAPMPVLMSLKATVERPGKDVLRLQADMARDRDQLVEDTLRSLDPVRRRPFRSLLRWAQRLTPYREGALFYLGSAWPPLRRMALELGRRLAESGSLGQADDVFFLESAELAEAIQARAAGQARPDLAPLARERRDLREARKRLHPPAAVPPGTGLKFGPIDLSGLETQKRNVGTGPVLNGFAVSPGRVTAPASVILSPADFRKMEPDTILVCPTTTPAWTPLFAQAKGLVTDIGGVAAHGSIVAREYGIPAVMGTGNGTQRIASGQQITVDGDVGLVLLEEDESGAGARSRGEVPRKGALSGLRGRGLIALATAALVAALWRRRRPSRS